MLPACGHDKGAQGPSDSSPSVEMCQDAPYSRDTALVVVAHLPHQEPSTTAIREASLVVSHMFTRTPWRYGLYKDDKLCADRGPEGTQGKKKRRFQLCTVWKNGKACCSFCCCSDAWACLISATSLSAAAGGTPAVQHRKTAVVALVATRVVCS